MDMDRVSVMDGAIGGTDKLDGASEMLRAVVLVHRKVLPWGLMVPR
jgi:predicted dinucleotide-utilizing enzyme